MGIYYGTTGGRFPFDLVMIGDHHLHPQGLCQFHLLQSGDAAVHRNNEACPVFSDPFNGLPVQAVPLLQAVGDVRFHRHAQF